MIQKKTHFQQLLQGQAAIVKCQTDQEYSYAHNQCSWCSTQFVQNRQALVQTFLKDKKKFTQIYNNCIAVGTELRNQYGQIPCGENADNQKMIKHTLKDLKLEFFTYSKNQHVFQQLAPFIPKFALQEFNGRKHTQLTELKLNKQWKFIMLGRHGQTFTAIRVQDKYLVLDSHVHFAGLMTEENLISYIKFQGSNQSSLGYLFVTIVGGKE